MTSNRQRPVVEDDTEDTAVTAHQSSPDRIVFTEKNNTDAWIATDHTVDVTR